MHQSAPAAAPISRCSDGPATRRYQDRVDRRCVFPLSRRRHRSARTSRKNPQQRACHFCGVMLSTACARLARRRGQVVGTEQDKLSCGPTRGAFELPPWFKPGFRCALLQACGYALHEIEGRSSGGAAFLPQHRLGDGGFGLADQRLRRKASLSNRSCS
jgi:hypothetical protein